MLLHLEELCYLSFPLHFLDVLVGLGKFFPLQILYKYYLRDSAGNRATSQLFVGGKKQYYFYNNVEIWTSPCNVRAGRDYSLQ